MRQSSYIIHLIHVCGRHATSSAPRPASTGAACFLHDGLIPPAPPTLTPETSHILFFDGSSRGNPGPGGSGACVVRVNRHTGDATVVWTATVCSAHPATTNNQAEYKGLLVGLHAALRYRWSELEVVGDSALVLDQLRLYRAPKNSRLRALYAQARCLADQLDIRRWSHHVRASNRMADTLANLAMDTKSSSQVPHPTTRPGHVDIPALLHHDLRQWLADTVGGLHISS